jgi:chaperonin GroEL
MTYRSLLYSPDSLNGIAQGIEQIGDLLAVTLGPTQGVIFSATGPGKPERLLDAGLICRRVTELSSRPQDVGAMIIRSMAGQVQDKYQEGVATAAVLARAMVRQAIRQIAAGSNPMLLRRGMETALDAALQTLDQHCLPAHDRGTLESLVMTAIGDAELSRVLGEMFDLLGKYGTFMVEEYAAPRLDREYIDGGRWQCRPASRLLMPPGGAEVTLHQPLVAIIDEKIESFARLRPLLEIALHKPEKPSLLLVCREIRGEALEGISANHHQGKLSVAVAVPTVTVTRISEELDDMALLTGAEALRDVSGRSPEQVKPEFLGRTRQITLTRDSLTIVGGTGDQAAIQKRITQLQNRLSQQDKPDEDWDRLRLRAARLAGSMAILKVGAHTFQERDERKTAAKKAMRILELAMSSGVLPGGGAAYLDCIPAVLARREHCLHDDERRGVELVATALEAPFLQIVRNHGKVHPPIALADTRRSGAGYGFDVSAERVVSMLEAGIVDSYPVVCGVLAAAVSAAATAITIDIIVLR